jgi:hypothetical protein
VTGEDKDSDMSSPDVSTDFDGGGARNWHVSRFRSAGDTIFTGIMLPVLASLLVGAAWSFWALAYGAMGSQGAVGTVVALAVAAAAFSWRTRQWLR